MSYSPPGPDSVDFEFESYSSPGEDNVDFDFTQFVQIQPSAVELRLDPTDPLVSPGFILSPSAVRLDLQSPNALVSPGYIVAADPVELSLQSPDAFVSPGVPIRPDVVELDLATPTPLGIQPFLLNEEWQVDQLRLRPTEINASPQTTSLTFEVPADEIGKWRQFDRAGDISIRTGFGGQFRAVDRGGRDAPVAVRSSFREMRPFQPETDYFVSSYNESQLAPDRFEVSLTLQRISNRGQAFPSLSQSADDWVISLESSTLAVGTHQVSQVDATGTTAGAQRSLAVTVSDEQAGALVDDLGYPDGVSQRAIPDAENTVVDESPDSRQTITITAPAAADIPDGDYFVRGWSLTPAGFEDRRRWRVEFELEDG